jgi:hypothetical protein
MKMPFIQGKYTVSTGVLKKQQDLDNYMARRRQGFCLSL